MIVNRSSPEHNAGGNRCDGWILSSARDHGPLFPGLAPVSMDRLITAYLDCIEGQQSGQVVKVY